MLKHSKQKNETVLAESKKWQHLNDTKLFMQVIRLVSDGNLPWDVSRELKLTDTEYKTIHNSLEFKQFKDTYFEGIRHCVEFSHKEQLQLFSKYDKLALKELITIGLESDKEAFRIQALKIYLSHSGLSRGQLQDKEYQQLKELVEEMAVNQDRDGDSDAH